MKAPKRRFSLQQVGRLHQYSENTVDQVGSANLQVKAL